VTAGDYPFFLGLYQLVESLKGRVSITLFDLGLTSDQREWLTKQGVIIRRERPGVFTQKDHLWQTWNKPFYIYSSPYKKTLWIDSDCIVVNDLRPLFDKIEEQPVFMQHPAGAGYTGGNQDQLYHRFPVKSRLSKENSINAGVVGVNKSKEHQELVYNWMKMVNNAFRFKDVERLIGWHDEGCLHWAVCATGMADLVIKKPEWNCFLGCCERALTVSGYVEYLKEHFDRVILHHTGPKCWSRWSIGSLIND
jgi:lipopolysaccharide biosynthesis glycosyltransferase